MKRYAGLIRNRSIRNTDKKPYDNKSKSTGVYKSTIKMIQNNQSLRDAGILNNVLFVYAAGSNSEEDQANARKNAERSI